MAAFDCRISQLPTAGYVRDYFRWRAEDAHRNALNAHCYWMLRDQGHTAATAAATLDRMSVAAKNELLFQLGVNYNELPAWQKRGVGLVYEHYDKAATNPITGEEVVARRRRIRTLLDLPRKDDYDAFILNLLASVKG
ncbi:MAG TPA: hypothetical protein VER55_04980 [Ardenticatenaceae bacterium]|nr:hypothetical protein [Ardenticatenaceae bacterium]